MIKTVNGFLKSERSVSPVVGVILAILITIFIVAIASLFIFDLADQDQDEPAYVDLNIQEDPDTGDIIVDINRTSDDPGQITLRTEDGNEKKIPAEVGRERVTGLPREPGETISVIVGGGGSSSNVDTIKSEYDEEGNDGSSTDSGNNDGSDTTTEASFSVTIDSTNEPVNEGEALDVTATIENTGSQSGTQTVDLKIGSTVEDTRSISVDSGASVQKTFTWTTEAGEAGDYTATVVSNDASDTQQVTISSVETTSGTISENPPIEGATVRAVTNDGEILDTDTTNTDGEYTVITQNADFISATVNGDHTIENTNSPNQGQELYATASQSIGTQDVVDIQIDTPNTQTISKSGGDIGIVAQGNAPILIGSIEHVQAINSNSGGSYKLINNVDASDTNSWNSGSGFKPIESFSGTLDGDGYEIQELYISRDSDIGVGLMDSVDSTPTITNIYLVNADIKGGEKVGGVVGNSNTDITNVHVTGQITSTSGSAGGIVGYNTGSIKKSSSVVDVSDSGNSNPVGGIVGYNTGSIKNTYSIRGSIESSFSTGGIVGDNVGGTISNTYAANDVTGSGDIGGLAGYNSGTIESSYWDTSSTNTGISTNDGSRTQLAGLTTTEMQGSSAESNMPAFDFTNVWTTINSDYPELQDKVTSTTAGSSYYVSIDSTNDPVDIGNNLDVTATIENTGTEPDTQDVELEIGTLGVKDTISVSLSSGESIQKTFSWNTDSVTEGDYDATVVSNDASDTQQVTIEKANTASGSVSSSSSIEGATIRSVAQDGEIIDTDTTDTNGEYTLNTQNADFISVSVDGTYTIQNTESQYTNRPLYATVTKSYSGERNFDINIDTTKDMIGVTVSNGDDFATTSQDITSESRPSNPKYIESIEQLQGVNRGDLVVVNDIDASNTVNWNNGNGFEPINNSVNSIEGNSNTISDIYIDNDEVGIINSTKIQQISNINIENADIKVEDRGGILLTSNYLTATTIDNVHVSGTIDIKDTYGADNTGVGGVVGSYTGDSDTNKAVMTDVHADVVINGDSTKTDHENFGGLIGSAQDVDIKQSTVSGSSSIEGHTNVGGVIGSSNSENTLIENSISKANVVGHTNVGGMSGNFGTIKNSYSTGNVIGTNTVGGLAGSSGSAEGSYWDTTATIEEDGTDVSNTGLGDNTDPDSIEGLTTTEMQGSSAESNMPAFDFTNVWTTVADDYPQLR